MTLEDVVKSNRKLIRKALESVGGIATASCLPVKASDWESLATAITQCEFVMWDFSKPLRPHTVIWFDKEKTG